MSTAEELVAAHLGAPSGDSSGGSFAWATDVQAEDVEWLWSERVPRGALTVLAGDPGQGKSILTCELAARVSRGQPLPPGGRTLPATVAMLSAEDALGAVVRPRLDEAGADLARVALWNGDGDRPITFPSGVAQLEEFCAAERPALVVVDPITAFLDAELNGHRDQHVRQALRPLARLAEETGAAIVVVMHLNKGAVDTPLYRLGGSIGFAGAARSVLLFGPRPDAEETDDRRLVAVAKSSYAALAPAVELTLQVEPGAGHPSVGWGHEVGFGAVDLLRGSTPEERSDRDDAMAFLEQALANGPRSAKDVTSEAATFGISKRTLRRARKDAGVSSERRGGLGSEGGWWWSIEGSNKGANPPGPLSDSEDGPLSENQHENSDVDDSNSLRGPPSESGPLSGPSAGPEVAEELAELWERARRPGHPGGGDA